MTTDTLFRQHIARLQDEFTAALNHCCPQARAALLYSGSESPYYQDDQYPPFRAWGHFLRWVPIERPGQYLLIEPGRRPVFYAVVPQDFWHDQSLNLPEWWATEFEIVVLADEKSLIKHISHRLSDCVFLGDNSRSGDQAVADALGIAADHVNPTPLLAWLDYQRACKSDYEVRRIAQANVCALDGHQAAYDAFQGGGDEYDIHLAYLQACRALDEELPYPSIVALNQHAAILHYQHKQRRPRHEREHTAGIPAGRVLLIDAGCRVEGYCSDITRTWATPGTHPVFLALLAGMNELQQRIIGEISSDMSFVTLHQRAHYLLAELLLATDIARGSADELLRHGVAQCFMPHGLGHMLGLQVHDTGGRQIDLDGTLLPPPAHYPALRTTRTIEPGMVFTIEPGVYFIPVLLDALREDLRQRQQSTLLNWSLIDQLAPLGGIRIEDNIHVASGAVRNLTRQPLSPQLSREVDHGKAQSGR